MVRGPERIQLLEHLTYHTAAVIEANQRDFANFSNLFTVTLLKIRDRNFALTAGHCIADLSRDTDIGFVVDKITESNSHPRPVFLNRKHLIMRYCYEKADSDSEQAGIDCGYIEIPSVDKSALEYRNVVFMAAEKRVRIYSEQEFYNSNDFSIMCGYPKLHLKSNGNRREFVPLLMQLCGGSDPPHEHFTPRGKNVHSYVFYGKPEHQRRISDEGELLHPSKGPALKDLKGTSGCGHWCIGRHETSWKETELCLFATQSYECHYDNQSLRANVAVLIGHHLRQIANDYPDLEAYIYQTWPRVREIQVFVSREKY